MNWPTDMLAGIYLCLFAFGLLFSFASLLLGAGHDHFHLPGGEHLGHAGHHGHPGHVVGQGHGAHAAPAAHGGHAAADGPATDAPDTRVGSPSPLNLSTVMMFITWFGGVGYLLRVYYGVAAGVSLLLATLLGLVGASLVYFFLARVLWRWQTELDPANYYVEGALARVTSPIRAGGVGEIVYALDQKQRVDGARSADGTAISAGTEVEIVRYQGGLAYVRPWNGALNEGPFRGRPVEPLSLPPPGAKDTSNTGV